MTKSTQNIQCPHCNNLFKTTKTLEAQCSGCNKRIPVKENLFKI